MPPLPRRPRVLLLEPFAAAPRGRALPRPADLSTLALNLHIVRTVLRRTGPMRLGGLASPPLGLAQLSASLRRAGFETTHLPLILTAQHRRLSGRTLRRRIGAERFDAVCLSVGDPGSAAEARRFARVCKAVAPGAPLLLGGSHPTFHPGAYRGDPHIDLLVRGQGDRVLPLLLDALLRGEAPPALPGVGRPGDPPPAGRTERIPLCELPAMDLEGVRIAEYLARSQMAKMQTGQGCPGRCPFCLHHQLWGTRADVRPLGHLERELRAFVRHDCRFLYFIDSTFTLDRDHALAVAGLLGGMRHRLNVCCETRADLLDPELLQAMRRAGFLMVWLGAESGSPRVLQRIAGKRSDRGKRHLDDLRRATRMVKEAGLLVGSSWLVGLPGETLETVEETIALMEELVGLGMDMMDVRTLLLLPGTDYHRDPAAHGLRLEGGQPPEQQFRGQATAGTEALSRQQVTAAIARVRAALVRFYGAGGAALPKNLLALLRTTPLGALLRG